MSKEVEKGPLRKRVESLIDAKLLILDEWARTNIPWKLDQAGDFVRDRDGERTIDYYPDDVRAFSEWDITKNCEHTAQRVKAFCSQKSIPLPQRFSRDTLGKSYHSTLLLRTQSLLKVLAAKAASQIHDTNKTNLIKSLTKDRDYWKSLALHQEQVDIVIQRRRAASAERELAKMTPQLERNKSEARREITSLEARVAELTASLAKVKPLREEK